ncbi:hypothetical protein EKG38_10750 [Shewanella canadensis]|uniref:LPP20 lipoprotein n=1 Tax=Shewanella canadensis TaxID=271096 RepID=A0A431WSN5_9GAMM|nr:hypothetical protein [Shewanella canadensis]RTR38650.1 hypothetical protein EKG38_10750 [Shewanella canadensis]
MKNVYLSAAVALATLTLSGCSTTADESDSGISTNNLPSWYLKPVAENGIAAASCVNNTGNIATAKAKAETRAIASLASKIGITVEKRVKDIIKTSNNTESNIFMSQTISHVQQLISGANTIEVAEGVSNGKKQLCVLVSMDKDHYEDALKKKVLDPTSQEALITGFTLAQAEQKIAQ